MNNIMKFRKKLRHNTAQCYITHELSSLTGKKFVILQSSHFFSPLYIYITPTRISSSAPRLLPAVSLELLGGEDANVLEAENRLISFVRTYSTLTFQ